MGFTIHMRKNKQKYYFNEKYGINSKTIEIN